MKPIVASVVNVKIMEDQNLMNRCTPSNITDLLSSSIMQHKALLFPITIPSRSSTVNETMKHSLSSSTRLSSTMIMSKQDSVTPGMDVMIGIVSL